MIERRLFCSLRAFGAVLLATFCLASCSATAVAPKLEVTSELVPTRALVSGVTADMDGRPLDLDAGLSAGHPLVLVFWQTWCGSCLAEAPALAKAARSLEGRVDFLGVVPGPDGVVDDAEVRRVSAELRMPYPHLRDRDVAWTKAFEVEGTPTLIALDSGGSVIWRGNHPPKDWASVLRLDS